MKVLMTGGSGFLGNALRKAISDAGGETTCLSRSRTGKDGSTRFVPVDSLPELSGFDVVVNLAGEKVAGLWTRSKRRAIVDSRLQTTRALSDWIEASKDKPRVFLSASAIGIYGNRGAEDLTERSDVSRAEGFLAALCRDWEHAASPSAWRGVRTVLLRTGHVLGPGGGLLGQALPLLRRLPVFILGDPDAQFSWIALDDWTRLVMFAIEHEEIAGPLNVTAPKPVSQGEFTRALAARIRKRVWGHVPPWALSLVAGEFGSSMTFSQRVLPEKALSAGFRFRHTELGSCLDSIPLR